MVAVPVSEQHYTGLKELLLSTTVTTSMIRTVDESFIDLVRRGVELDEEAALDCYSDAVVYCCQWLYRGGALVYYPNPDEISVTAQLLYEDFTRRVGLVHG